MDLEVIILSEGSQMEKGQYYRHHIMQTLNYDTNELIRRNIRTTEQPVAAKQEAGTTVPFLHRRN